MCKRVGADDRLVGWDIDADARRDEARGAGQLASLDVGMNPEEWLACLERHHHLLQRGIAGALADAIDGAFRLSRSGAHSRQRVRHGESEIVVAVSGDRRALDTSYGG